MKKVWFKSGIMLLMLTLFMSGCTKDDQNGNVEVQLTDAPFPMSFVASVNMNITKVEVENAETGEYVTVYEGSGTYNVAALTNGATAEINVASLPAGTYDKVRVTVDGVNVALTDGRNFDVSAGQSFQAESNIVPALHVNADGQSSLLIDVDLAESFDFELNNWTDIISSVSQILGIGDFDLDFRAADLSATGTVSGTVTDENGHVYANATIELETGTDLDGDGQADYITTISDANGQFKFLGVPAGSYQIKVEAEDGTQLVSDGQITVSAGAEVSVNTFHAE